MTPKAISDVNRSERIERELRRIANYKGVGDIALSAADELARLRVDAERTNKDSNRIDWLEHFDESIGFRNIDRISSVNNRLNGKPTLREAIDEAAATAPKQVADSSGRAEEEKDHG